MAIVVSAYCVNDETLPFLKVRNRTSRWRQSFRSADGGFARRGNGQLVAFDEDLDRPIFEKLELIDQAAKDLADRVFADGGFADSNDTEGRMVVEQIGDRIGIAGDAKRAGASI